MKFTILTPLWTGGVANKVERIYETGILGSMRWWYEVLLRGVGVEACNPNTEDSKHKCGLDIKSYDVNLMQKEKYLALKKTGLCAACQLFGATGWRRRFRLLIEDRTNKNQAVPLKIEINRENSKSGKKVFWQLADYPRTGELELKVHSLSSDFSPEILEGLLQFIADWGALGAKGQLGFGVVKPKDVRFNTEFLYEHLEKLASLAQNDSTGEKKNKSLSNVKLPSLQNMFFAKIKVKIYEDNNCHYKETFYIKHDLRKLFSSDQELNNKDLRHYVMGTVQGEKMAAKIKISRPYNENTIRIWGWLPHKFKIKERSWDREKIIQKIYNYLSNNKKYELQDWREFNSKRDKQKTDNPLLFLKSLLGL